tara:strand:+ start:1081 stop:1824 length:744 start_codon:yes stop_codon:yes gene_type:complete
MNLSLQKITIGTAARTLVRGCDNAVLSTGQTDNGWPYGSLVMTACDYEGRPIMLLSDLAEHSKNLKQDTRVSLVFDATDGLEDRLTGARVTVMGRAAVTNELVNRRRYLARHPSAAAYADFDDFNFYTLEVIKVHQVAGFGRIDWIPGADFLYQNSSFGEFAAIEVQIVENFKDRSLDMKLLCSGITLAGIDDDWEFTGVDPEGCDLRAGGRVGRLKFNKPVNDVVGVLDALKNLAGGTSIDWAKLT